jgi:hypothetical protein
MIVGVRKTADNRYEQHEIGRRAPCGDKGSKARTPGSNKTAIARLAYRLDMTPKAQPHRG